MLLLLAEVESGMRAHDGIPPTHGDGRTTQGNSGRHFEKNGTRHFSLIGRHLESVSRTIPVFKHTLAPSEKWPTQEISVRFGPFLSSYRVNIARCNLSARAKVKGRIKLKIEENTSVGKLVEPFQIFHFFFPFKMAIFHLGLGYV